MEQQISTDTNIDYLIAENENSYPNISQSWGIVGMSILAMVLFAPVKLVLDKSAGTEISFFVYYLLAMGATFWVAHRKRKYWTNISHYNFDLSSAKVVLLISIAVIAIQTGIISPIVYLIPMPEFIKEVILQLSKRNGIFSFISIVIAAPILEELIFRGIMLNGLLKKYSPVKAIIISSFLFGFIHLNPWQFIGAFILGIFSGWVYFKTRKLSLCILIHFVNNFLAFGTMYFIKPESLLDEPLTAYYGGLVNLILITAAAIIVAIVCLYFLRFEFKRKEINYGNKEQYI